MSGACSAASRTRRGSPCAPFRGDLGGPRYLWARVRRIKSETHWRLQRNRGFDNHRLPALRLECFAFGPTRARAGGQHPPPPEGEVWSGGSVNVAPRRACPRPSGRAQLAFKDFDGSRDYAIHTKYRI
ncbi:hypothetical protein FNV43_RR01624 [Rhamnella rubrinervis]|uniref:Uncharacterized protein n=1 Tax=Rhamnella rubrinervis TaxID=2594499 RepID=A0A8K0MT58_9ROSA|nr:hypothetical protein FNV43_RR01624 [Rhamnella rubrinervis]